MKNDIRILIGITTFLILGALYSATIIENYPEYNNLLNTLIITISITLFLALEILYIHAEIKLPKKKRDNFINNIEANVKMAIISLFFAILINVHITLITYLIKTNKLTLPLTIIGTTTIIILIKYLIWKWTKNHK